MMTRRLEPGPSPKPCQLPALALLIALVGCTESADDPEGSGVVPPADPEVIAVYDGGQVTRADVDRAVLDLPAAQRQGSSGDEAAAWYEGLVEELVVERLLASEAELLGVEEDPEVRAAADEVSRQAISEVYLQRHLPTPTEIGDDEVRRYYEDHRERYDRQGRRLVLHLFKRRPADGDLAPVQAELAELRRRAIGGESFATLAKEHSESESRHREGHLGWLVREQLPQQLAEVIFSLPEGVPSEPLPTDEGAHLFLVEKAVEARSFALDEVENLIRRQLLAEQGRRAVDQLAAELPKPDGSFVATAEELVALLAAGDPQATVLRIGDYQITAARFRTLLLQNRQANPGPAADDLAHQMLQGLARREQVYLQAQADGIADDPEVAARLERLEQRTLLRILRQRSLQRKLSAEADRLQEYYDNNQRRFSSPLRLETRRLKVPLSDRAANRGMARLEALAGSGTDGGSSRLDQAAAELGGEIEELGWKTLSELARLDPRLAGLAANLQAGALSAPYRSETSLEMLEVIDRREPEPLPFATVIERVRAAYGEDHGQEIYREWLDSKLADAGFVVFPERLTNLQPAEVESLPPAALGAAGRG